MRTWANSLEFEEWKATYYDAPDVELVGSFGFNTFCICTKCAALVSDDSVKLEKHVEWHAAMAFHTHVNEDA